MRVGERHYRAVWWERDAVAYVDQRLLPFSFQTGRAATVESVAVAIERMGVRGAPTIGVMAAYGLALAALLGEDVAEAYSRLLRTRPTAVNLRAGLDAVRGAGPDHGAMLAAARRFDDAEVAAAKAIGEHGLPLIAPGARVLTHCNAGWLAAQDWGTALAPVYRAAERGRAPFVYVDETRPRLQGARLTAWELGQHGIDHAVIIDGAAAALMRQGKVDLVITGADRIAANGDVANKIGTYSLALAARAHGVPFYVAAPLSTIDPKTPSGDEIPIEERDQDEVLWVAGLTEAGDRARVRIAAPGSRAGNLAFDVTPHRLATGLVTNAGIVDASPEGVARALRLGSEGRVGSETR